MRWRQILAVLDEMPDGVVIMTPDGTLVYRSKGAESVFGYTEAEALQHSLDGLIAPHDQFIRHT